MIKSSAYLLHKLVYTLDRMANTLLLAKFGISYNRALFLVMLKDKGTMTQHELAVALGYTDPAVSTTLVKLVKEDYVIAVQSPQHKRKRLISLSSKGKELIGKVQKYLDSSFIGLLHDAQVDEEQYRELIEKIYNQLQIKERKIK